MTVDRDPEVPRYLALHLGPLYYERDGWTAQHLWVGPLGVHLLLPGDGHGFKGSGFSFKRA